MLYGKVFYEMFCVDGNIAFTTCLSKLMMENLPHALQRFNAVICIKQVQPSSPLQLEDMPWLFVCVGGMIAVTVCQDVEVASVDAEVKD